MKECLQTMDFRSWRRSAGSLASVLAASWALLSCQKEARETSLPASASTRSFQEAAAARWVFHPLQKAPKTDSVRLAVGELEVDEAGSRWLRTGKKHEVSAFGAPEPLSAVLSAERGIAAVGKSGTVYLADQPLGPFVEVRQPKEPYLTTERAGSVLVAIAKSGAIHRSSDAGLHWTEVSHRAHFVDLIGGLGERVLAYSVPEQWYESMDQGKTFERLDVPSIAPRGLAKSTEGKIIALGFLGAQTFEQGRFQSFQGTLDVSSTSKDAYVLPTYARASSIEKGHASMTGSSYVGLQPVETGWRLWRGSLGEALDSSEVLGLTACSDFRVAARRLNVIVVCQKRAPRGVSPLMEIFRSRDGGKTFAALPGVYRGAMSRMNVAVGEGDSFAVTGLCPQEHPEKGCVVSGLRFVQGKEEKQVHLPGVEVPYDIAFDEKGRLWATGRRSKDGHVLLFGPVGETPAIPLLDLSERAGFPLLSGDRVASPAKIHPGSGGLTSVSLRLMDSAFVAVLDDRGALLGRGLAPPGNVEVAGAGKHLIALTSEGDVVWESTTGGLSWQKQAVPRQLCQRSDRECELPVACTDSGCLIGDELTRLGWGVGKVEGRTAEPPSVGGTFGRRSQPGFVCHLGPEDWTPLPGLVRLPDANDALLGDAAWSALASFPEHAAATALRAQWGKKEIVSSVLLPPVSDASAYVYIVARQVEGSAVARVRYGHLQTALRTDLAATRLPVEVAWDNRIEDVVSNVTFEAPVQVLGLGLRGQSLQPDADHHHLSVAGRGIFVRMTPPGADAATFFIEGNGKQASVEELGAIRWPRMQPTSSGWLSDPIIARTAQEERVRVGGEHLGLLRFAGDRVILTASDATRAGERPKMTPYLMGVLSGDRDGFAQRVSLAYRGKRVGFVSMQIDLDTAEHRATFVELKSEGGFSVPVEVPLQEDLPAIPGPCSALQRKNTTRVLAPEPQEVVRPVVVELSSKERIELQTDEAVLFGSPQEPCLGAAHAAPAHATPTYSKGASEAHYTTLVFPGTTSWLFRAQSLAEGVQRVSARPMECVSDHDSARSAVSSR